MRRVRSQLNNLATAPAHASAEPIVQQPLGYNHHTDEIQRRIETMGVLPDQYGYGHPTDQTYAAQMHQGNVMQNQPPYPMQNNLQHPHAMQPQQNYAPAPVMQQAPIMQPQMRQQSSLEVDNIKASLERLTHKLQGLTQNQSGQTVQNSHLQQATSRITEQYQNISSEMKTINESISNLAASNAQNQANELAEMKSILEQHQEMFKAHVTSTQDNQIDPNAYATAVEVSHAEITGQVNELRTMLDGAFTNMNNADNSQIEAAVSQAAQSQADLYQRVEQFEADLKGNLSTTQNDIINQINAMQVSLEAIENKPAEQHVLDTSSLDMHLEEINRAIVALSSADNGMNNLERIEARISDVSKMLDETQNAPSFDADAIYSRFDAVNSAISELGNNLADQNPNQDAGFDGLAAQINKLSEKVDNISALPASGGASDAPANSDALLERLDQLVDRVETIESPAVDVSIFSSIQDQIGDMSSQIQKLSSSDAPLSASDEDADAVMEQLKYISSTVYQLSLAQEQGEGSAADDAMLNGLGEQITALSNQMTSFDGAGFTPETLSPISDRLSGIEQQLGASRDIAIELATQAAQEAVENTVSHMKTNGTASEIDMTPIQQLSEQVQYLKEANDTMNSSNIDTIDAVKDIFSMMAERLSNIESQVMHGTAAPEQPSSIQPLAGAYEEPQNVDSESQNVDEPKAEMQQEEQAEDTYTEQAYEIAEENTFADDAVSSEMPQAPMSEFVSEANDSVIEPEVKPEFTKEASDESSSETADMPIEPGTGGPDLALLVRQAKDRRGGMSHETDRPSNNGNQFRQIARDAMRVSQVEENRAAEEEKNKPSKLGALSKLIQGHKKSIIIAAAAALLLALSIPLASKFLSSDTQTASSIEQPQPLTGEDGLETLGETSIATSEELSEIQAANSDNVAEQNLSDTASEIETSVAPIADSIATESSELAATAVEASAGDSLFSTEATSSSEGFGVEAASSPVAVEQIAAPAADIPFGSDALKAAVASNEPKALFEVGKRYTDGSGVEKNLEQAATWYERSAESGFAPAQYIIGNFNEKGIGLERNPAKAATWYETAANNGNVIAMHNLAVLYATPGALSEQPDMATAFEWFKKAADHGVRDSQVNAGIFHTNGAANGETNLIEAYKWFAVAGNAGDKDALSKRDVIGNAMRPDQLEQAKSAAKDWKPAEINRDANEVQIPDAWKDAPNIATAAPVIDKSTVRLVQATLAKLGFDAGPADGVIGNKTRNAISAFQKRIGVPQNGKIDAQLVQVLKQVSA